MNKERLLMMKNLMDEIQEDKDKLGKFDLCNWIKVDDKDSQAYIDGLKETTPSCGFSACACGWAGVTKEFNDLGLWSKAGYLLYTDAPAEVINSAVEVGIDRFGKPYFSMDNHKIIAGGYYLETDFPASSEFFGLDCYVSEYLFDPDTYGEHLDEDGDENFTKSTFLDYTFPEELVIGEEEEPLPKHVSYRIGLLLGDTTQN